MKEYLQFRKFIRDYQKTELTDIDKKKIEAFDKELIDKLVDTTLESLTKKMLQGELSSDFVNGAKFSLYKFIRYFK